MLKKSQPRRTPARSLQPHRTIEAVHSQEFVSLSPPYGKAGWSSAASATRPASSVAAVFAEIGWTAAAAKAGEMALPSGAGKSKPAGKAAPPPFKVTPAGPPVRPRHLASHSSVLLPAAVLPVRVDIQALVTEAKAREKTMRKARARIKAKVKERRSPERANGE